MGYVQQNEKKIKRGLKWLEQTRDAIIEEGMKNLLQAELLNALAIHDDAHYGHRITEDSHGWALVKNGQIIQMGVNEGRHGSGNATREMQTVAQSIGTTGYVGIILASMDATRDNGRPIIFEVDFELDVLNAVSGDIKANIKKYIKPIK